MTMALGLSWLPGGLRRLQSGAPLFARPLVLVSLASRHPRIPPCLPSPPRLSSGLQPKRGFLPLRKAARLPSKAFHSDTPPPHTHTHRVLLHVPEDIALGLAHWTFAFQDTHRALLQAGGARPAYATQPSESTLAPQRLALRSPRDHLSFLQTLLHSTTKSEFSCAAELRGEDEHPKLPGGAGM